MEVLVCGDRNWIDRNKIKETLEALPSVEFIMHRGARGAEALAWEVSRDLNIVPIEYPANWTKHGNAAGMIRDKEMLDDKPSLVLAFCSFRLGKDITCIITEARKRGIPTRIIK